jgi:hypothetical protein
MFYNSKKLIDEKVLQQYFFEAFMLADKAERKRLLPIKFEKYAPDSVVKGLSPECTVGMTSAEDKHLADFTLYPVPNKGLQPLNIEIKWNIQDFEKQTSRFNYYNGTVASGFVVAVRTDKQSPKDATQQATDEMVKGTNIPIVYLDADHFRQWFVKNAYLVASQAISNKFGLKPERQTGPRYWIIYVSKAALSHYHQESRTKHIWAFKDSNNPKNIISILHQDRVIFVALQYLKLGRNPLPYAVNKNGKENDWAIDLLDVRVVNQGFHLNYTNKAPYNCFEGKAEQAFSPEKKAYTQFVTFMKPKKNDAQYEWRATKNVLEQKLFMARDPEAEEFVQALKQSMNDSGDAREISANAFHFVQSLLD